MGGLRSNFGLKKSSDKLDNFFLLSFSDLLNEVKRLTKKKLPLREQDEWEDYFKYHKAELLNLNGAIHDTES